MRSLSSTRLLPWSCFSTLAWLWHAIMLAAAAAAIAEEQHLVSLNGLEDEMLMDRWNNVTRASIVDRVTTLDGQELGVCHIAVFNTTRNEVVNVFDSNDVTRLPYPENDPDLGSPNHHCDGGGF